MSSRALSLATILLLIGFGATDTVFAQATNLEAGKAPSQLSRRPVMHVTRARAAF